MRYQINTYFCRNEAYLFYYLIYYIRIMKAFYENEEKMNPNMDFIVLYNQQIRRERRWHMVQNVTISILITLGIICFLL